MDKNNSCTNDQKTSPYDFATLNKEIKADLMSIVDDYGFKEAPELQAAIDSGKIQLSEVKEKVSIILRKKFAEIFNKKDYEELMQGIKDKEVNFPEFYSYMSNFLKTVNPKADVNAPKTKHNVKPLSDG